MKYRKLGTTDLNLSVIGVGTWQFGGEWGKLYTQPEVDAILDAAGESGINLVDTAECYGDHLSEKHIGDYLSRHDRSKWIVATKFGHHFNSFMNRTWQSSVKDVEKQLEDSLRALRIDVIDLYQYHSGTDEEFQKQELWDFLAKQKKLGKIKHIGISIAATGGPLQAQKASLTGAVALQVMYNRLVRRAEQDFLPSAREQKLGVLARVPLASGYLSGKFTGPVQFPKNDVRSTFDEPKLQAWLAELELIRKNELPAGVPMAQWALAWCLRDPIVTTVIPGCKDVAQTKANAAAADLVK